MVVQYVKLPAKRKNNEDEMRPSTCSRFWFYLSYCGKQLLNIKERENKFNHAPVLRLTGNVFRLNECYSINVGVHEHYKARETSECLDGNEIFPDVEVLCFTNEKFIYGRKSLKRFSIFLVWQNPRCVARKFYRGVSNNQVSTFQYLMPLVFRATSIKRAFVWVFSCIIAFRF